jgi:hypothetical protein
MHHRSACRCPLSWPRLGPPSATRSGVLGEPDPAARSMNVLIVICDRRSAADTACFERLHEDHYCRRVTMSPGSKHRKTLQGSARWPSALVRGWSSSCQHTTRRICTESRSSEAKMLVTCLVSRISNSPIPNCYERRILGQRTAIFDSTDGASHTRRLSKQSNRCS